MGRIHKGTKLNYRHWFDGGAEGMFAATSTGDVLDANQKACRVLRRTLNHLKAAGRDGVFDPDDPRVEVAFEKLMYTGEFEGELRLLRWNGTPFTAEVSMSGLDEGLVSVVFKDAAAREEAREGLEAQVAEEKGRLDAAVAKLLVSDRMLRRSEELFELAFQQAAVGMALVLTNGGWMMVNGKLCEILGYDSDELLEMTFQDLTHPEDLDKDLENVGKMLRGEIEDYSMEKRYFRKDGSTLWAKLTVSLVRGVEENEPSYFVSVIDDGIDSLKRSETILRSLTPREAEILRFLARGQKNREIARATNLSEGTVKRHVQGVIKKLGVSGRSEAGARAVELGLIEPKPPADV